LAACLVNAWALTNHLGVTEDELAVILSGSGMIGTPLD
jgi:hypothetical protein